MVFSCAGEGFDSFGAYSGCVVFDEVVVAFFGCHLACDDFAALSVVFVLEIIVELFVFVDAFVAHACSLLG